MGTHRNVDRDPSGSRLGQTLTWLGGGDGRAGIVVVVSTALAWLTESLFVGTGARFPDRVEMRFFRLA